jgi:SlyX protein
MEDRLITLETRLAHFEKLAEELSDVLFRQGQSIDRLCLKIERLQNRLDTVEWAASPRDEQPPPHY